MTASATLAAATGALARVAVQGATPARWGTATSPSEPLLWACEVACVVLLARLAVCSLVCAAALVTRGRRSRSMALILTPRALRPWVVAVLLSGMGLATVGPAAALGPASGPTAPSARSAPTQASAPVATALPDAGWTDPGLPVAGWRATAPPGARHRPAHAELVASPGLRHEAAGGPREGSIVVRRGDCLWTIAARHLGPQASDAEIAAQWPRWWAVNRDVVGDDPNRLHPGDVLQVPARALQ